MTQVNMMSMLVAKMDWLSQNQGVIARNISNMSIPGAKARELEKPNSEKVLSNPQTQQARTHPGHLAMHGTSDTAGKTQHTKNYKVSITGNDIHYMDQLRQANESAAQHQQVASLYSKFSNIFRLGMK